jgi:hypothetical protein
LRKKGVLITCVVIGLGLIIAWFILAFLALRGVPDLAGGVTIKANPGVRIYLGDKPFTNRNVSWSWNELLREETRGPLAIEVSPASDPLTPEALGGPGAQVLRQSLSGGGSTNIIQFHMYQYLLRRTSGKLDQVLVLLLDLQPPHDPPRRVFVPIRARESKNGSMVFLGGNSSFTVTSRATFLKLFGLSPSQLDVWVTLNPATPPGEFAQEIKEKGLWEPSGN